MNSRFLTKLLAVVLVAGTLLSTAACGTSGEEEPLNTAPSSGAESAAHSGEATEGVTEFVPDIEKKDYDSDFNIVTSGTVPANHLVVAEEDSLDSALDETVYERSIKIQDHLGVTCNLVNAGSWTEYYSNVMRTVQAGDDDYQLVYTHVYNGISALATSNVLYDFQDFGAVNLEAPYWANDLMEDISIQGKFLLGYNDTCLSCVHCILFNKDLLESNQLESPYELVRNKTWTFDKLAEMSSTVHVDDGSGTRGPEDTYGITGWGWTCLISFITSSDLKMVDRNAEGEYEIAYTHEQEKMLDFIDQMFALYNAESTFFWKSSAREDETVDFSDGTSLFHLYHSTGLIDFRDKDVRFGVLPYPLYDEQQEDYRALNWNGLMCVPGSIQNEEMVGEVVELMAYYTAPVKDAYYENLLAAKLAEAPDDVEMLNILWGAQVSDLGLIFASASTNTDAMLYMIPGMCEKGKNIFSSYVRKYGTGAQQALDQALKQGKYAE